MTLDHGDGIHTTFGTPYTHDSDYDTYYHIPGDHGAFPTNEHEIYTDDELNPYFIHEVDHDSTTHYYNPYVTGDDYVAPHIDYTVPEYNNHT